MFCVALVQFAADSDTWVGSGPEGFSERENPTHHLQKGDDYELLWENRDDERHQFAVVGAGGDELATTKPAESYGEVRSMVITANPDTNRYLCTFHPDVEEGEMEII